MSARKTPLKASTCPKPSIDSVLDQSDDKAVASDKASTTRPQFPSLGLSTLRPSSHARPGTSTRPSWIGSKPSEHPVPVDAAAMKQPVTIKYSSPDLQPPVFIFTSLGDPPWDPVEMSAEKANDGQWVFSKTFEATEGEYQYKLRLGPGDWWVTDDNQPLVDDGDGNKNNLIVVQPDDQEKTNKTAFPLPTFTVEQYPPGPAPGPLMDHEMFTKLHSNVEPASDHGVDHEGLNGHAGSHADQQPLLQHESLNPTSAEQEHAPLFRHESMAIGVHGDDVHEPTRSHHRLDWDKLMGGHGCVPAEADASDTSLEPFPTDKQGIYEKLRRASIQAAEDSSSCRAIASSNDSSSSRVDPLPSVSEDDEEDQEMNNLHKIEEREAQREIEEEGDPLQEGTVVASLTQTDGLIGTAMDLLRHPMSWVAIIGLALGVVAGWYKLRYA